MGQNQSDWKRRDSFVLYTDHMEELELLNMEQRGLLFTAIMTYQDTGVTPDLDGSTAMLFSVIRKELDRNAEKYFAMVEQRRKAGAAGGRASARNRKASSVFNEAREAIASFAENAAANQAENDIEDVYEYANGSEDENGSDYSRSITTTIRPFKPPNEKEVIAELESYECNPDLIPSTARSFIRYNEPDHWLNCQRHFSSWEYALITFIDRIPDIFKKESD